MEIQLNDEKCAVCGVVSGASEIVDAIDGHEIIKACTRCAEKSKFPIIRKPTQEQINRANRFYGVRDRLMVDRPELKVRKETPEDKDLKRVIAENAKMQTYDELIDNFHWHIQQGRRMKKISQKQLAEMIAEPEVVVSMAEQGKLPEDYSRVISKFEQFLKVKLKKQDDKSVSGTEQNQEQGVDEEGFDIKKANFFKVTTGYLKSLKEKMIGKQEAKEEKKEEQEKTIDDEKLVEGGEVKN